MRVPGDAAGFVSVEDGRSSRAVERLKQTLPGEPWPCPSCERPTDRSAVGDDAAGGV